MRRKTEERRLAILTAAAKAFRERGVEATTMSDIVARLGGSKSTLYGYFPSKAELVRAVASHTAELELQQGFAELDPSAPVRVGLLAFGKVYLRSLLSPEMLSGMRIAFREGDRSERGQQHYLAGPARGWRHMHAHITSLVEQGRLHAEDTWVATLHLKGLLQAELLDRGLYGFPPPSVRVSNRVAERAVDAFLRAYGPDSKTPSSQ